MSKLQYYNVPAKKCNMHLGKGGYWPTISTFYGMLIKMFFDDHSPAHFHVQYAEFKAVIAIESLSIIRGHLPRRAQELVLDWTELHQQELLEDWALCQAKQQPKPIEPLL